MEKFLHILWFTFIFIPLMYWNGLSLIILCNQKIVMGSFDIKKMRKKKQQIDKDKFAKFMRRVCK